MARQFRESVPFGLVFRNIALNETRLYFMRIGQAVTDKFAVGLSLVCLIHCLVAPFILIAVPSLGSLMLDSESFHLWMVVAVIPTSIYALTLGCKKHKRYRLLALGGVGLALLLAAVALGEVLLGEMGEKALTVVGVCFLLVGHVQNYQLCRVNESKGCACPGETESEAG